MNKISAVIKDQATRQFAKKRHQVIQNSLDKHKDKESFQDVLNVFMNREVTIKKLSSTNN